LQRASALSPSRSGSSAHTLKVSLLQFYWWTVLPPWSITSLTVEQGGLSEKLQRRGLN